MEEAELRSLQQRSGIARATADGPPPIQHSPLRDRSGRSRERERSREDYNRDYTSREQELSADLTNRLRERSRDPSREHPRAQSPYLRREEAMPSHLIASSHSRDRSREERLRQLEDQYSYQREREREAVKREGARENIENILSSSFAKRDEMAGREGPRLVPITPGARDIDSAEKIRNE